jgi:hypothetical protein
VFFVADVQTGFGPFVAVYLTSQKWTQVDIGFCTITIILTIGLLAWSIHLWEQGAMTTGDAVMACTLGICRRGVSSLHHFTGTIFSERICLIAGRRIPSPSPRAVGE